MTDKEQLLDMLKDIETYVGEVLDSQRVKEYLEIKSNWNDISDLVGDLIMAAEDLEL